MVSAFEGFLSCVCVAHSEEDFGNLADFSRYLETIQPSFEIIVCVAPNLIDIASIEKFCTDSKSLAIYEISTLSLDALYSAGLELALGDWILELPNIKALKEDAQNLIDLAHVNLGRIADSYQLSPSKLNLIDRILSLLSSFALGVPVYTMIYMPRLTTRAALQVWNTRKLRSKVIRVAPQLGNGIVITKRITTMQSSSTKRLIRVGLRTLAHSSAKPLRWVSSLSLFGAFVSVAISVVVLVVGINKKVVSGWTTTNLQISGLSFLTLLVLGVLTEYIYQIAATSIDQPAFRVIREHISQRYDFRIESNVIESRVK